MKVGGASASPTWPLAQPPLHVYCYYLVSYCHILLCGIYVSSCTDVVCLIYTVCTLSVHAFDITIIQCNTLWGLCVVHVCSTCAHVCMCVCVPSAYHQHSLQLLLHLVECTHEMLVPTASTPG